MVICGRSLCSTAAESGLLNGHNMESAEVNGCVTLFDSMSLSGAYYRLSTLVFLFLIICLPSPCFPSCLSFLREFFLHKPKNAANIRTHRILL